METSGASAKHSGTATQDWSTRLHNIPLWGLLPLIFAAVLLSHATLLRLPYFWDEAGYYIPAAWDMFQTGTLIPQTTMSNAHPPVPSLLLAGWWRVFGYSTFATRTLVCLVASAALLGVYRMARNLTGVSEAVTTTLLTAIYPIWFAQSTLAHADIFAAAFTLWGLSFYLSCAQHASSGGLQETYKRDQTAAAVLFALAALSKETAIGTPVALLLFEIWCAWRDRRSDDRDKEFMFHLRWAWTLATPMLPLTAWYGYHRWRTGFMFGNPEYLRYNATANLDPYRVALSCWHRLLHLTMHMNLFVATGCMVAALLMPAISGRRRLSRGAMMALAVVLVANTMEYSVLGGALLTRYLLPMYPLVLMVCVIEWRLRVKRWMLLATLTAAAFLADLWINPPYAFAPEDNLTYRDMVVLHQQAIAFLADHYPAATVLTAWPGSQELGRPNLGYTRVPIQSAAIKNFSWEEMHRAAADPGAYEAAFLFSTKWEPPPGAINLGRHGESNDMRYFDFHHDLHPEEAARLLHGEVVWQRSCNGEWAAVLHFPRSVNAGLVMHNAASGNL